MYNIPANNNLSGNAAAGYCDTEMNCTADSIAPYKESMFWNILCSYRKFNNESAQIRNDICKRNESHGDGCFRLSDDYL